MLKRNGQEYEVFLSVTHSSPKLSQAKMSTGRTPSIDHSTISMAPVSDAGTIAMRKSAGTRSSARERSMASFSFALAGLERCERPTSAPSSACRLQPGRFLVGPGRKRASTGRTPGMAIEVFKLYSHPYRWASAAGSGWPAARISTRRPMSTASIAPPLHFWKMTMSKVWFITGASRGLGVEFAKAALRSGDRVVATGRKAAAVRDAVGADPDKLLAVDLDVTDAAAIKRAVDQAVSKFGTIDVLVNNAGYGHLGYFEEASDEAVRAQFETNVFGAFAVTRAVLPVMRAARKGRIFNLSSAAGIRGQEFASSTAPASSRSKASPKDWQAMWLPSASS